ncbi:tyrosinase family oxidase copper chaperone [Nonomuraea sp. NPDC050556]|uniref:tyrosinase family oxidase copper chaperone n=1 Tax=Nonomuraea sp. NPDC050556 TaxID=3364369 RepID=UPI0037921942
MWTFFWRALLGLAVAASALTPLQAMAASTSCSEETYLGRAIRLCPDAPASHGLLASSVFIDDVALVVLVRDGRYVTVLNQYVSHASLRDAARDAVSVLGGAALVPPEEQVLHPCG